MYNLVVENPESTVVAEYRPPYRKETAYQSEADLEKAFIHLLQTQAYEYLPITSESDLISNLRCKLETLNNYQFTEIEWKQFFTSRVANLNMGVEEKTHVIQEDHIQLLTREDGTVKNIRLIDKENIHNNSLQVINQYETDQGQRPNRYDVTILVNGLPLVHVELKKRGVYIKEAFNQINRYSRESFWAGSGLFEYVQLFVISNGTHTKYYSNTTRSTHIREAAEGSIKKGKRSSNSFEFTSWWADANNRAIADLMDFGRTFFAKHTLLNVLIKYCVFTTDRVLLAMRPYQIVATEKILTRINVAHNYKTYGTVKGGGYIWHTTGSGKTLTSFKTAQIASKLPYIDKVLFVVDRKDLDYQTMKEYDRFEKGAANSNTSTKVLERQLGDGNTRIIITTIQKLSVFINRNANHKVFDDHVVIIFDECHRSQFGDMHRDIVKAFKKYHLFGFTGTPIFADNSTGRTAGLRTTEDSFGSLLHIYTIVDAINDRNVLPFRVDYIKTMGDLEPDVDDNKVADIDRERAFLSPKRIGEVTRYILENFNRKTYRNENGNYSFSCLSNVANVACSKRNKTDEVKAKKQLNGFNSIFCVSSIEAAKLYYNEFKKQMSENPDRRLNISTIFSYGANEEVADGIIDEENPEDTTRLDQSSRDFLDSVISDYNEMFSTNYDTSGDKFQNFYKDVSLRMKNRELDLLIVVNMFLTGFDATTLNTLWVDKNLREHGLIQAFSRTNRILNSIKTFGNIVCFRNLQKRVDEAISRYGDKEAGGISILHSFKDYYYGFDDSKGKHRSGYKELVDKLTEDYPLSDTSIIGEERQKSFISLFGGILRMCNLLSCFDEFEGKHILSDRDMQDYQSRYLDINDEWKRFREKGEKADICDDIVFEIELIKQVEISIDYILMLVKKYHDSHCKDKEILVSINKAICSSVELRSKKVLIEEFLSKNNEMDNVSDEWKDFVSKKKDKEMELIISEEGLNGDKTRFFMDSAFRNGAVKTIGKDLDDILPPVSRFGGAREKKKASVLEKLLVFFDRYFGL